MLRVENVDVEGGGVGGADKREGLPLVLQKKRTTDGIIVLCNAAQPL